MDIAKMLVNPKLDTSSNKSLYLQIAENIADKIKNRVLPSGQKLLPERDLAELYGVSRTTAINAYRLLEQQGLVRTKVGSGTYVSEQSAADSEKVVPWLQLFKSSNPSSVSAVLRDMVTTNSLSGTISFATGMPDPEFYPVQTFADLFNKYVKHINKADFGYIAPEGYEPLRRSIAEMLTNSGIPSQVDEIMVVSGAQQGIYLLSKALLEQGDYVVMESPTFIGAIQAFQAAGAKILNINTSDTQYLSVLEDYLIRYRPKMLYIMPTYQNPSGHVIPLKERQDLLELAARYRLVIVEDDPYRELYYGQAPPPALKSLDFYGGVIYLGTFSKILAPGLKIGYIAASPLLIKRMALDKQYVDLSSNNITQWLLHTYLAEKNLENHLSYVRGKYKKRRDAMAKALRRLCENEIDFDIPEGGYYFWCRKKKTGTVGRLVHEAAKNGVSFVPGDAFYPTAAQSREFRLCFVTNNEEINSEGIRRLAKTLGLLREGKKESDKPSVSGLPIL